MNLRLKPLYITSTAVRYAAELSLDTLGQLHLLNTHEAVFVDGLFTRASRKVGYPYLISLGQLNPAAFEEKLREHSLELRTELIERSRAISEGVIVVADDIAYDTALMLTPEINARIFSLYRFLLAQKDLPQYVFHSDGDLTSFLGLIKQAGFDGIHCATLDPRIFMAVAEESTAQGLPLIGGFRLDYFKDPEYIAWLKEQVIHNENFFLCDDGGFVDAHELAAFVHFAESLY